MSLPLSYLDARDFERNPRPEVLSAFAAVEVNNAKVVEAAQLDAEIRRMDPSTADHFFVQAMTKRLAVMRPDLKFSVHLLVLLASLSDRIGVAIFWAYTMMDFDRRNGRPMMIADFLGHFGNLVPTEAEQRRLWDAQKATARSGGSDNLIDGREAWAARGVTLS